MNEVIFQAWDSAFFGHKIGSLHLIDSNTTQVLSLLESARIDGYQLVYVFVDRSIPQATELPNPHAWQLVDTKRTYAQPVLLTGAEATDPAIRPFGPADDCTVLYELAYQSGEFSRFRVDTRFGQGEFRRFYRQWIDNSLTGEIAHEVFVYIRQCALAGFITIKQKQGRAIIGLLATEAAMRGRGIGNALINQARHYAAANQLSMLEVVTQGNNEKACRFYEKAGFTLKEIMWVYHCWL